MSEYTNNQDKRQEGRREALKRVIRRLHQGESVDEVKSQFARLLEDVGGEEIAEIEQALIAEGMPEEEIKRLCDVHVAVFRESLDEQAGPEELPGHPIHTLRAENAAAADVIDALGAAIEARAWEEAREHLDALRRYERHYLRKENILFPYLERHGFTGPSQVMWAIHDDVRAGWKELGRLLTSEPDPGRVARTLESLATAMREMFYKEEKILFPTALELLDEEEWGAIRGQEADVGYFEVTPGDEGPAAEVAAGAEREVEAEGNLALKTGALTLQQVDWLFGHLPVDVTFVDEKDEVRFFSETSERIFPRSPAIIGRKVQQCHPPASVDKVQQILDAFRAGTRDVAEFWIQMARDGDEPRMIHIRYFAVRDEAGSYRGTLEVTQDVSHIRTLEGERRLLDG